MDVLEGGKTKRHVNNWWLNALIVTTVLWMWATIAGGIWIGVEIAKAESDAASVPTYSYEDTSTNTIGSCNYDSELEGYYDEAWQACTP